MAAAIRDEKITVALGHSEVHKAHIIDKNGESYRFRQTFRRQEALKEQLQSP